MSKGKRNKTKKQQKKSTLVCEAIPVAESKRKNNHAYWVTGYYWMGKEVFLIEPFCCVRDDCGYRVTNLDPLNDFYEVRKARTLLKEYYENAVFFEDRLSALKWIESIENEKYLLDRFAKVFDDKDMQEYVLNKGVIVNDTK